MPFKRIPSDSNRLIKLYTCLIQRDLIICKYRKNIAEWQNCKMRMYESDWNPEMKLSNVLYIILRCTCSNEAHELDSELCSSHVSDKAIHLLFHMNVETTSLLYRMGEK